MCLCVCILFIFYNSRYLFCWLLVFFFSFIFISWRIITLQYCSGFCHTLTWISHGLTCVPCPDPMIKTKYLTYLYHLSQPLVCLDKASLRHDHGYMVSVLHVQRTERLRLDFNEANSALYLHWLLLFPNMNFINWNLAMFQFFQERSRDVPRIVSSKDCSKLCHKLTFIVYVVSHKVLFASLLFG